MKRLALFIMVIASLAMASCGGKEEDKGNASEPKKTTETTEIEEESTKEPEQPIVETPKVYNFIGKVAGSDVHMSMFVDGNVVLGKYYYDSQRKKGNKASMSFFGDKAYTGLELTEFYTDEPTGQFYGDWLEGVYKGTFTRAKDGKTFDFELNETEVEEDFFPEEELDFEIPDFPEVSFDSESGSEDWDSILDEYEKYVDQYIKLYKKAMSGDMNAMNEYMEYLEEAQSLSEKLEDAEDEMTAAQMSRYTKITNKLAQGLM